MNTLSTPPGTDSCGYPVVTRAEAHALAQARKALVAIANRARNDAYSTDARRARIGSRIETSGRFAADALASFLIDASVYADSARADSALARSN